MCGRAWLRTPTAEQVFAARRRLPRHSRSAIEAARVIRFDIPDLYASWIPRA